MKRPLVQNKSVVVTGCSTGIGQAAALWLRAAGWNVIPTARKPEDLEKLAAAGFTPVALDVTDSASVQAAAKRVLELTGGRLGGLVNNAGFGQYGAVEDLSRAALRRQFEVNVLGLQELTNLFVPVFRRQGWGRIANISSVLGRVTQPMLGAYCASKYAVEALSDALRMELRAAGVGVSLIEPGPIVSEFRTAAQNSAEQFLPRTGSHFAAYYARELEKRRRRPQRADRFTLPPEAVARKIQHALESSHPRRRYCVTVPAHLGDLLARFAPAALIDRIFGRKLP